VLECYDYCILPLLIKAFTLILLQNKILKLKLMDNLTIKTIIFSLIILISGCSSSPDEIDKVPDKSAQALYIDAKSALDNGLYQKAIQLLSAIDSRFPFGPISHQVQLDLIYAYYKSGDTAQGVALVDRFLRLNPTHPDIDYVYYMRGLINQDSDKNMFQDLAGIDRSNRDASASRDAFNDFKTILTKYPNSKYAADAQKRMIFLKSRLARYELSVAEYYFKREAYAAAANRGRYIVEYFSPSPEVEQALVIMIECYQALGLDELAVNARQVLAANYPDNKLLN
jgi:outer membrane protein assembly factor BamD